LPSLCEFFRRNARFGRDQFERIHLIKPHHSGQTFRFTFRIHAFEINTPPENLSIDSMNVPSAATCDRRTFSCSGDL